MKIILFILFTLSFQAFSQDSDCVFDLSTQTDDFIKEIEETETYTWDDSKKEATILLDNGDTLIAHRGGCNHFGVSGTLIKENVRLENIDKSYIIQSGIWIAERMFTPANVKELKIKLETEDYQIGRDDENLFYLYFNHESYSEYFLRAERIEGLVKIQIGYYFN
ncbi:hypothetical protein [uncultured Marivirga sp.]|uniref:hypothetical protein n=1 Tax=uncultured Marivirga sp. TaxID=1123707 RepID=UPI0030EC6BD7